MLHSVLEDLELKDLTQYSVKKPLQVFVDDVSESVLQEIKQLHTIEVGQPKNPDIMN